MNNAEVLVKFKGDTKDLDEKTSKASTALKGFGKGLGGVVGSAGVAAAAGIAATTAAVVNLTKQSVEAYAEYEQLVGGVETLFKSSADKVEMYADRAYKTAGLSANEYMSTVTSFSASLLQSLGGDTDKAADYADRAIQDMADNANKMGTNIGMIQNAYQGFAKQNYMMLDNLKLGYGGTRTEMERLISDASKMTDEMAELGVSVDATDMSFGNIVNAISVVQKHLDITGTTSKEAMGTITGSLNMTKSAWENLVAGFAKDKDLSALVDHLIDSASALLNNLLPVVARAIEGIAKALPMLAQKIGELLPDLMADLIPPIIDAVVHLFRALVKAIPKIIPPLVDGLIDLVKELAIALPDILDALLQGTIYIIQALAEALPELIPTLVEAILDMIPVILENLPLFIEAGLKLVVGLIEGLIKAVPELIKAVPKIVKALLNAFKDLLGIHSPSTVFADIGKNLIKGLWNGISNVSQWIINKIKGFGNSVIKAIKGIFGVHSPSTEFEFIGKMNMLGLEKGMEEMQPELQKAINGMFDLQPNISGNMSNTLSPNLNVVVNNNMEVDPIGQVVNRIKTFSGGAKNDYNWGSGL